MEMDSQFLVLPLFLGGIALKEANTLMIVQTIPRGSQVGVSSVKFNILHDTFILL